MKRQRATMRTEADRHRVLDVLANVSLEKPLVVRWEREKKTRSLSQNNLYWMLVSVFADETGHTKGEMDNAFKQMFVTPTTYEINGKTFEHRSTSDKTTQEMSDITTQIYALGAQMGIYLPSPDDLGRP